MNVLPSLLPFGRRANRIPTEMNTHGVFRFNYQLPQSIHHARGSSNGSVLYRSQWETLPVVIHVSSGSSLGARVCGSAKKTAMRILPAPCQGIVRL